MTCLHIIFHTLMNCNIYIYIYIYIIYIYIYIYIYVYIYNQLLSFYSSFCTVQTSIYDMELAGADSGFQIKRGMRYASHPGKFCFWTPKNGNMLQSGSYYCYTSSSSIYYIYYVFKMILDTKYK